MIRSRSRGGGGRELDPRVDPLDLERVGRDMHDNRVAVADEEAQRVGDVELTLRVVRLEPLERGPELRRLKDVDAGVHLAERELVGRCVAGLDDLLEAAFGVAHDPAVRTRRRRLERKHGGRRTFAAVRLDQSAQELRREAGNIAVQDEHVAVEAVERGARGTNGVTGAERLFLHRNLEPVESVARVRRGDDDDPVGSACLRGEDHPVDEPAPEQRVQVLRQRGAHPRPESRGHDDGCKRLVGHGLNGWGARIRTWDRGTKTRCLTAWLRPTAGRVYCETV